jgi:hypothetical protein
VERFIVGFLVEINAALGIERGSLIDSSGSAGWVPGPPGGSHDGNRSAADSEWPYLCTRVAALGVIDKHRTGLLGPVSTVCRGKATATTYIVTRMPVLRTSLPQESSDLRGGQQAEAAAAT